MRALVEDASKKANLREQVVRDATNGKREGDRLCMPFLDRIYSIAN